MKAKWIAALILTAFFGCGITHAQESADIVTKNVAIKRATLRPKKPFFVRAAIAGASCGIAIGFAGNPATAAGIGLPIFIGGNALAYKLYQNHPRWSAFVQTLSPLGCYLGGRIGTHPKPQLKSSGPGNSGGTSAGSNSGSSGSSGSSSSGSSSGTGPDGTSSSGSGGSGSNGGVGSGTGSSSGSGSGGGTAGSGSGSGSTGAGSGSGSGGGGGKIGCIKDCGFPGNGGTNGGSDPKPPFPGQGNGGSNAGKGN